MLVVLTALEEEALPFTIQCPVCGKRHQVSDSLRGKRGRCSTCGTVVDVPAQPAPEGPLPQSGDSPPEPPAPATLPRATTEPNPKLVANLKAAGILSIVLGGLVLAWALLMAIEIPLSLSGAFEDGHDDPPREAIAAIFAVLFLLSVGLGLLQIVSGVRLLQLRKGARTLATVSGIATLAALWVCCLYPFCVPLGVYTLVILSREEVREVL